MYRVILTEDDPWIRRGLKMLIDWRKAGFEIVQDFDCVKDTLIWCEKNVPDLLITDICMDEADGFELIAGLREGFPALPVVILTAYETFDYARRALTLGAMEYLVKPVEEGALIAALSRARELLKGRRLPPECEALESELHRLAREGDAERAGEKVREIWKALRGHGIPRDIQIELAHRLFAGLQEAAPEGIEDDASLWSALTAAARRAAEAAREKQNAPALLADQALDYLRRHLSEELSLSRVAQALHVTPAYLGQVFLRAHERHFHDALHEMRVEQAKELLLATDLPVQEIAEEVGYKTQDHFFRRFKALVGITPGAFRHSSRNHNLTSREP